jgi:hypothetical protein
MEMRGLYFIALAALLLAALLAALLRDYLRARSPVDTTWEGLLERLVTVDREAIATIALDAVNETGEPAQRDDSFTLEPTAIWNLLGGLEGLEAIERNCQVLVELAAYLQRFYPEALVVAEQLRLNAREIEWHVGRLKGAAQTGNLQASFPAYAQRAVATYYLMTRKLLALYRLADSPQFAALQQAI